MIDESILRRLAYAKSLYHVAKNQFKQSSDLEISRSIVTLDNSMEAYLWTILEVKIPEKINSFHGKNFRDITSEITKHFPNFEKSSINELHGIRNNIQHNGLTIAESQASRYFDIVQKMFNLSSKSIFDIDWDFISLSILIKDKDIADYIQNAEKSFADNDFATSAKYLIMAFELSMMVRQMTQFGSGISLLSESAKISATNNPALKPLFNYVETIEEELEILKMGLEYNSWKGYRHELDDLNPKNVLYDYDKTKELDVEKIPLFKEDAQVIEDWTRRNFSFVTETILMWQNSLTTAGKPTTDLQEFMGEMSKLMKEEKTKVSDKPLGNLSELDLSKIDLSKIDTSKLDL